MATQSYLPREEAKLVTWTGEFLANIQAQPQNYGLVAQQATDYGTSRQRFVDAYNKVQNQITRTPPNIAAKNAAKKTLINSTRMLVDVVQSWPSMTNEKRRELKITERGARPVPVPVPGSSPFIKVEKTSGRTVTFDFQQDRATRGRPSGVSGVSVFSFFGDEPPTDPSEWTYQTMSGRTSVTLDFIGSGEAGTVWVTAFWFNSRKETGPASTPISINLPAASGAMRIASASKKAA